MRPHEIIDTLDRIQLLLMKTGPRTYMSMQGPAPHGTQCGYSNRKRPQHRSMSIYVAPTRQGYDAGVSSATTGHNSASLFDVQGLKRYSCIGNFHSAGAIVRNRLGLPRIRHQSKMISCWESSTTRNCSCECTTPQEIRSCTRRAQSRP